MTETLNNKTCQCLITRPAHQAQTLSDDLRDAGFTVLNFPTIEISGSGVTEEELHAQVKDADIILFVSRNAVDQAFYILPAVKWPADALLGVIGTGTAQALKTLGIQAQMVPSSTYNSEGLLEASSLQQVAGKTVLILRGQQGRNLLGDTLRERGAKVQYCEIYRRRLPENGHRLWQGITANGLPEIAVFTSAEGLNNFFAMVPAKDKKALINIPWVLISERMRETARQLGHNNHIIIADSANDAGISKALLHWQQH